MKPRQIKLLHAYPTLAGITEDERRTVMVQVAGCYSSRELRSNAAYEEIMAIYEAILWEQVDIGNVSDPRACRKCADHPVMQRIDGGGIGRCPVCRATRKVLAWTRDYWAARVPAKGKANSRVHYRVITLWSLLTDYLPPSDRSERYLAGIMANTSRASAADYLTPDGARVRWHTVPQTVALRTVDALKDRLTHAVGKAA